MPNGAHEDEDLDAIAVRLERIVDALDSPSPGKQRPQSGGGLAYYLVFAWIVYGVRSDFK